MSNGERRLILIQVGEELSFNLKKFAGKLRQHSNLVTVTVADPIPLPDNDSTDYAAMFANIGDILESMRKAAGPIGPGDSVMGLTSARISLIADNPEEECFSEFDPYDTRFIIISTALWQQRYEESARRNLLQFLMWAAASFLLIRFIPARIEHAEIRGCIGDQLGDYDSIQYSVRKARLCSSCQRKLDTVQPAALRDDLARATRCMLNYARRPRPDHIMQSIQEHPFMSFLLMGVLFSLFMGALGAFVEKSAWTSLGAAGLFVGLLAALMLKEHFAPGPRLR